MKKAYDYSLEALEKNENWLTPYTAVALIELYSGKIDQACSRLEKMNKITNNASQEISYKALVVNIFIKVLKSKLLICFILSLKITHSQMAIKESELLCLFGF